MSTHTLSNAPFASLQLVPKEALVWFEELSALMTQDDNYSRYRQALSTLPPDQFCVPFIGMAPPAQC